MMCICVTDQSDGSYVRVDMSVYYRRRLKEKFMDEEREDIYLQRGARACCIVEIKINKRSAWRAI